MGIVYRATDSRLNRDDAEGKDVGAVIDRAAARLLYEMFSDRLPFKGQSSIETMHAIIHAPAQSLNLHGLALPPQEDYFLIESMLSFPDPTADRYRKMKQYSTASSPPFCIGHGPRGACC
jgi:hypothetical protein